MYAYNATYLDDARDHLGVMFDYAINNYEMDTDEFWDMFAHSKLAAGLSCGNPKYIAGMSGTELFANMIYENTQKWIKLDSYEEMDRSKEYWAGWALAYYQWHENMTYSDIHRNGIKLSEIVELYILHEAPDLKFIEVINQRIDRDHQMNMLKRLRAYAGLTQKQLSEASGVSLRMIQLYEQGQNDISKAQANVVLSLSQVLGCEPREII